MVGVCACVCVHMCACVNMLQWYDSANMPVGGVCAHSVSFVASGALALRVRVHMVTRARLARARRALAIVNVAQMTRVRSTGTRPVPPTAWAPLTLLL